MTANNFYLLRLKPLLSAAIALLAIRFCGGQGGFVMPQDVSSKAMGLVPLPAGLVDPNSKVVSATVIAFTEGPAADAHGNIYFSDIINSRIMRLSTDGQLSVFRADSGRTNGNLFDREGRLVSCEGAEMGPGGRRRMVRTDMRTGEITVLSERYEGKRYNSPNDLAIDGQGRIYFTDPRYGDRSDMEMDIEGVYRIDPNDTVTRVLQQPTVQRPNGIAIQSDGRIDHQRLVYDFAPGRGGDGMRLDVEGNLWVAAGISIPRGTAETTDNPPGIYVITPAGKLLGRIPIPEDLITNLTFAGPEKKMLYVTAGKSLYKIRVNVSGWSVYPPLK
jgi:gluconolactonase